MCKPWEILNILYLVLNIQYLSDWSCKTTHNPVDHVSTFISKYTCDGSW